MTGREWVKTWWKTFGKVLTGLLEYVFTVRINRKLPETVQGIPPSFDGLRHGFVIEPPQPASHLPPSSTVLKHYYMRIQTVPATHVMLNNGLSCQALMVGQLPFCRLLGSLCK